MQKCILGKPILTQENAAGGEEKEAYFHAYRIREIGEYERKAGERLPGAHRPNEWLWKRIPDQVASNPLERAHRKRFLNMSEYSTFKSENSQEGSLTMVGGSLEVIGDFGNFFSPTENL